jgi:hypothetical protein
MSYFQNKHLERVAAVYKEPKAQAIASKDADKLDLILRAQYHYEHAGKEVDTTSMQFDEVKKINPQYYGL